MPVSVRRSVSSRRSMSVRQSVSFGGYGVITDRAGSMSPPSPSSPCSPAARRPPPGPRELSFGTAHTDILERDNDTLARDNAWLLREAGKAEGDLQCTARAQQELQQRNYVLEDEMQSAHRLASSAREERTSLTREKEQLLAQNKLLFERLSKLERTSQGKDEAIVKREADYRAIEKEVASSQVVELELRKKVAERDSTIQTLERQLAALAEAGRSPTSPGGSPGRADAERGEVCQRLKFLQSVNESLRVDSTSLRGTVEELQRALTALRGSKMQDAEDIDGLGRSVEAERTARKRAEAALAETRAQFSRVSADLRQERERGEAAAEAIARIDEQKALCAQLRAELRRSEELVAVLRRQAEAKSAEIAEAGAQLRAERDRNEVLRREIEACGGAGSSAARQWQAEAEFLSAQIQELRQASGAELQQLRQQLEGLQPPSPRKGFSDVEVAEARAKLSAHLDVIAHLEQELAASNHLCRTLREELDTVEGRHAAAMERQRDLTRDAERRAGALRERLRLGVQGDALGTFSDDGEGDYETDADWPTQLLRFLPQLLDRTGTPRTASEEQLEALAAGAEAATPVQGAAAPAAPPPGGDAAGGEPSSPGPPPTEPDQGASQPVSPAARRGPGRPGRRPPRTVSIVMRSDAGRPMTPSSAALPPGAPPPALPDSFASPGDLPAAATPLRRAPSAEPATAAAPEGSAAGQDRGRRGRSASARAAERLEEWMREKEEWVRGKEAECAQLQAAAAQRAAEAETEAAALRASLAASDAAAETAEGDRARLRAQLGEAEGELERLRGEAAELRRQAAELVVRAGPGAAAGLPLAVLSPPSAAAGGWGELSPPQRGAAEPGRRERSTPRELLEARVRDFETGVQRRPPPSLPLGRRALPALPGRRLPLRRRLHLLYQRAARAALGFAALQAALALCSFCGLFSICGLFCGVEEFR
eukprot:TRINITY_DN13584_c0_g1_i2.p1 TRINITY_DN13584_c0_g1~~TRINITY_DN13584_c0_g1_i2.p1  ORF type:complete len:968 (+),score=386.27 TRINITY_DN13584_c0_g1_i2:77-2905(+)